MKKTLSLLLAFALVIALSVAGTVAYLQDKDTVTNTFTVGNVEILLDEAPVEKDTATGQYVTASGDRIQANTYENLVPGQTVQGSHGHQHRQQRRLDPRGCHPYRLLCLC